MLNKRINAETAEDWQQEMCEWEGANAAFIKQDWRNGQIMWSIYDAFGERIASTDNRDFAFIIARQNDLEPVSAH